MSDAVVIGGGIVGVSTALFLAEGGARVTVVERATLAGEASGLNGGVVGHSRFSTADAPAVEPADADLATGGIQFYRWLSEDRGHDIGLKRCGGLSILRTGDDLAWAGTLRLANAELLDSDAAREIEPALSPDVAGALWAPDTVTAEPVAAVSAAATEARRLGARFELGGAVTSLATRPGGGFRVGLDGQRIDSDLVAITAGPWSGHLARLLGPDLDVPVAGVLGQMWATEPLGPTLRVAISSMESLRHWATNAATSPPNLTHDGDVRLTRHLYGRQRPNGEIVFGGDRRLIADLTGDRRVDDDGIDTNFAQAAEILPALRGLRPVRTWAGIMPWTADGLPILGPLDGQDGAFVATGLASSGFTRGPAAGRRLAELMLAH